MLDFRKQRPEAAVAVSGLPGCVLLDETPRIYLFTFGAVVVEAPAIDEALRARLESATAAKLLPETEEIWKVSGGSREPGVGWDRIELPELDARRRATVALLLAQSAALERYDRSANVLLDEVLALLSEIEHRGRLPLLRSQLIRRIAGIGRAELQLSRDFFLVDRPDLTWEDPGAARVFDMLYEHLELEERHAAVQQKLSRLSGELSMIADLQIGREGLLLEIAIVFLIVVEVVMALLREG